MKNKKDITIYDIAEELNVSPSTVSRALKDHHSIGKKTKKAVKKFATEIGYKPNNVAASLRNNKTNTIGVIISWINRPFISSLISGIESVANREGYNVIFSQSNDKQASEISNAHTLFSSRVEGLIVSLAMETTNYDHFKEFTNSNIPVVFVDRVTESLNTDLVVIDNTLASFTATQHLIEQGCKRIAHFAGAQHRNVYRNRRLGYEKALKEYGLEVDESLIVQTKNLSSEEGYEATEMLLKSPNPPDGIFAANDTSAISAIQCAKKMGVEIPSELAIIGFNNDPICEIIDPPLSSMSHPAYEMGELAMTQLLRQKEKQVHEHVEKSNIIKLKTELIARQSSLRS
jgi:DNA-binding LacI/PurR family transcriptional regulator